MAGFETSIGGRQEAFPDTEGAAVVETADDDARRRESFARLCTLYWRPVYRLIRAAHGRPVEEAKDLTQAFFCHLLEDEGFVGRWRPETGRFRHYLKGALGHFLVDVRRAGSRICRGGDRAFLSLDVSALEDGVGIPDRKAGTPEAQFDRQWARDVVARSVDRLKERLRMEGRTAMLAVYEAYELDDAGSGGPSYRDLARRFGITEAQVTNHLHHARRRFQDLLAEELSACVGTRDELEQELRELFGVS